MPKRAVFERSRRRELSLDISVGVHISWLWSNRAWKVSLGGVCQDSDTDGTGHASL